MIESRRAINLTKTFPYGKITEEKFIRYKLSKETGEIKIIGWKIKKVNSQIYLVYYVYEKNNEIWYFPYEVNLDGKFVRNINNDEILKKKYQPYIQNLLE
jgi:hypothetical protein